MPETQLQFCRAGLPGREQSIAYRHAPGTSGSCGLVWLAGLKSDMDSTKATAVAACAEGKGLGMTRFDYSGHGRSSGRFEERTIGDWLAEANAVFTTVTKGPQAVLGSSTGGYVALLLRQLLRNDPAQAARIRSLVLVAPAWDLTERLMWDNFTPAQRAEVMERGLTMLPSGYGEPYAITRDFIVEGRQHLLEPEPFDPGRPVLVLQGLRDASVPAAHTRGLDRILTGGWLRIEEVADGDHSLSREADIARLCRLIDEAAGI
jgi:pimeloyl-ACP methyl ester carboxylesterase